MLGIGTWNLAMGFPGLKFFDSLWKWQVEKVCIIRIANCRLCCIFFVYLFWLKDWKGIGSILTGKKFVILRTSIYILSIASSKMKNWESVKSIIASKSFKWETHFTGVLKKYNGRGLSLIIETFFQTVTIAEHFIFLLLDWYFQWSICRLFYERPLSNAWRIYLQ